MHFLKIIRIVCAVNHSEYITRQSVLSRHSYTLTSNKISYRSLFLPITAMSPTKRHSYWHQLQNDVIQKVDSGSKLQKEYNITSGNLSKWISSANEINDKIFKRQCEVMKEVETDKEQMKKYR